MGIQPSQNACMYVNLFEGSLLVFGITPTLGQSRTFSQRIKGLCIRWIRIILHVLNELSVTLLSTQIFGDSEFFSSLYVSQCEGQTSMAIS